MPILIDDKHHYRWEGPRLAHRPGSTGSGPSMNSHAATEIQRMATAELPRPKKPAGDKPASDNPAPRRRKKSCAFRWACWLTLIVLIAGAYLAPMIVVNTPLHRWILQSALAPEGSVSLGSASLGWFSPVTVESLTVRDASGEVLLEAELLRSDKSLIAMLINMADLGVLHVERPTVHVVANDKQTNLEQVFGSLLSGGGKRVAAQFDITQGIVIIDDVPSSRKFRIEDLSIHAAIGTADANGEADISLTAFGALPQEQQPGSFKIELQIKTSADNVLAAGKVESEASALPLELLRPLLRRRMERAELAGQLSAQYSGAWGALADAGKSGLQGRAP